MAGRVGSPRSHDGQRRGSLIRPGPALLEAVNQALYAAAAAVETPGGQSIVALLAHVPKVIG